VASTSRKSKAKITWLKLILVVADAVFFATVGDADFVSRAILGAL
jgi:hypothetical protein